jgi:hypothetical protein
MLQKESTQIDDMRFPLTKSGLIRHVSSGGRRFSHIALEHNDVPLG